MSVTLMGAGPGDPELMTRKAWRVLSQADVVLHDALVDLAGMREAAPHARWLDVGKRLDQPSVEQSFICSSLLAFAKQGKNVVRLKGGDPSIFGRLAEELEILRQHGIPVEVVPGVTAACAAAATLQASLTLRGISRSVAFVTPRVGHRETENETQWIRACMGVETVVLYMAGSQSQQICQKLIDAGKSPDTAICLVENASRAGLRLRSTLGAIAAEGFAPCDGPVTLLIGAAMDNVAVDRLSQPDRTDMGHRHEFREFAIR